MKKLSYSLAALAVVLYWLSFTGGTFSAPAAHDCACCDQTCVEAKCCDNCCNSAQGTMGACTENCTSDKCKECCKSGTCSMKMSDANGTGEMKNCCKDMMNTDGTNNSGKMDCCKDKMKSEDGSKQQDNK